MAGFLSTEKGEPPNTRGQSPQVQLYIRGASIQKGSTWAYVLVSGEHQKTEAGHIRGTSPSQAALTALVHGLRALKHSCEVVLITSSTYITGGIALLKAGTCYDTYRLMWLQLADLMTKHTLSTCYSPIADTPLLKKAYDLAVTEMFNVFGIEKELLGEGVKP